MASDVSSQEPFEPLLRPRQVWGWLRKLRISRGWEGPEYGWSPTDSSANEGERFATIRGLLKLDDDAVVVIGSKEPATRDIPCVLQCIEGDDFLESYWKQLRASPTHGHIQGTASAEIHDALCAADKRFEQRPPSMTLVFSEARTTKPSWNMECFVPAETFAALTEDIRARRCERVRVAVSIFPAFTNDQHGWPTEAIDIAIAGNADGTFAFGTGWLQSIRWEVARDAAPSVGPVLEAIQKLTLTVRRGFILLLVLLGLVALLRL
jgi:hypothetical protein